MVTKKKSSSGTAGKRGRAKVGKLNLNKETVKDLTSSQQKQLKGGLAPRVTPKCGDFPKTADTVCNCA